jgi:ferrous iron transport protein A
MSNKPLSEIKKNEIGLIQEIEDGKLSLRLMEMGCIIGEEVRLKATAPLGDPIAIEVAGYNLSLRKSDASKIKIKVVECI